MLLIISLWVLWGLSLGPFCQAHKYPVSKDGTLTKEQMAKIFKEIKSMIMSLDLSKLKPQCRKAASACKMHLLKFMPLVNQMEQKKDIAFKAPCVLDNLRKGIPDMNEECDNDGKFGEGMKCFTDPAFQEVLGPKIYDSLARPAMVRYLKAYMQSIGTYVHR